MGGEEDRDGRLSAATIALLQSDEKNGPGVDDDDDDDAGQDDDQEEEVGVREKEEDGDEEEDGEHAAATRAPVKSEARHPQAHRGEGQAKGKDAQEEEKEEQGSVLWLHLNHSPQKVHAAYLRSLASGIFAALRVCELLRDSGGGGGGGGAAGADAAAAGISGVGGQEKVKVEEAGEEDDDLSDGLVRQDIARALLVPPLSQPHSSGAHGKSTDWAESGARGARGAAEWFRHQQGICGSAATTARAGSGRKRTRIVLRFYASLRVHGGVHWVYNMCVDSCLAV